VNLFEVYCKKEKSGNFFLHIKNGSGRRSGFTYRRGYSYRASCNTIFTHNILLFEIKGTVQ
jgi:hypothetical protein